MNGKVHSYPTGRYDLRVWTLVVLTFVSLFLGGTATSQTAVQGVRRRLVFFWPGTIQEVVVEGTGVGLTFSESLGTDQVLCHAWLPGNVEKFDALNREVMALGPRRDKPHPEDDATYVDASRFNWTGDASGVRAALESVLAEVGADFCADVVPFGEQRVEVVALKTEDQAPSTLTITLEEMLRPAVTVKIEHERGRWTGVVRREDERRWLTAQSTRDLLLSASSILDWSTNGEFRSTSAGATDLLRLEGRGRSVQLRLGGGEARRVRECVKLMRAQEALLGPP